MNHQSAKAFLAIVEHGSISAAADALYFSQPALSSYLSRLENELGVRLFLRQKGSRKITLTPEGERFIPVAQEAVQLEKHLQEYRNSCQQKTFRIGASHSPHEYIIRPIAEKLQQMFPDLTIPLYIFPLGTYNSEELAATCDGAIRFFYSSRPRSTELLRSIPYFSDPQYLLCPADTPLPDRLLTPDELDPSFLIRQAVVYEYTAVWYQQNIPAEVPSRYPAVMTLLNVIHHFKDPRCCSFIPASVAEYLMAEHPGELTYRRVSPSPPPRTAYIFVSKTYSRPDVIRAFLQCCREYLEERPWLESLLPEDF